MTRPDRRPRSRRHLPLAAGLAAALVCTLAGFANANAEERRFAIIVGTNASLEPGVAALRYADDDALRYQALFGALGVQTFTLASVDESSRRLHPHAASVPPPTRAALRAAVDSVARGVSDARTAGHRTSVYFIYAGHGARDPRTGEGFLTLSDARLTAPELFATLVAPLPADNVHILVDACHAQFLAEARGPGGKRRPLRTFAAELSKRALDRRVGLLFATSSMRKTFEYEGFQAGVFSHLVRSGLHGAADLDLDGIVSYDEIQRFVAHAVAPIPNELYRPQVHALPPEGRSTFVDLRDAGARIVLEGTEGPAHHVVEDRNGVRLFDFHNAEGQPLSLVWPQGEPPFTLHEESSGHEVTLPAPAALVKLSALREQPRTAASRGAADHAFRSLFAYPFDRRTLAALDLQAQSAPVDEAPESGARTWSRRAYYGAAAAATVGAAAFVISRLIVASVDGETSQTDVRDANDAARTWRTVGWAGMTVAGAAALTGLTLSFLPGDGASESYGLAASGRF